MFPVGSLCMSQIPPLPRVIVFGFGVTRAIFASQKSRRFDEKMRFFDESFPAASLIATASSAYSLIVLRLRPSSLLSSVLVNE